MGNGLQTHLENLETKLGGEVSSEHKDLGQHLDYIASLLGEGGSGSSSESSFSGSYNDLTDKPVIVEPTQFYFAYSKTTSYDVGDIRTYDGKFYMCKTKTPYPCGDFDASYWVEVKAGTPCVGLSSAQVTGTALNANSSPKVNNPECTLY